MPPTDLQTPSAAQRSTRAAALINATPMPRPDRPCAVCATPAAKYNCPKCRAAYCSIACCRTHKATCVPPTVVMKARPKRVAPEKRAGRPPDPDSDVARLTPAQLSRISSCTWARDELRREPTLRDLLVTIEGSNDPKNALQTARAKDSRFADFVDRLLVEVGACAFEDDGSVVFVGAGGAPPAANAGRPERPIYK